MQNSLVRGPGLLITGFVLGVLTTYGIVFRYTSSSRNEGDFHKQWGHFVKFVKAPNQRPVTAQLLPSDNSSLETSLETIQSQILSIQKAEHLLSQQLFQSVRILCWIMTSPIRVENRQAILDTWGFRCQILLFIMGDQNATKEGDIESLSANAFMVRVKMTDTYNNLFTKTKLAFKYVASKYDGAFDWVLKVDDDSYVVMDNLRLFLSDKEQKTNEYYGAPYKSHNGYNSGGPGYVISAYNVRRLFVNGKGCDNSGTAEDIEIANCLRKIGINIADTRDENGRFKWSPFEPEHTMHHELLPSKYNWFWGFTAHKLQKGFECCSDDLVSFHYISPSKMRVMEYLIHYLHPFSTRGDRPMRTYHNSSS